MEIKPDAHKVLSWHLPGGQENHKEFDWQSWWTEISWYARTNLVIEWSFISIRVVLFNQWSFQPSYMAIISGKKLHRMFPHRSISVCWIIYSKHASFHMHAHKNTENRRRLYPPPPPQKEAGCTIENCLSMQWLISVGTSDRNFISVFIHKVKLSSLSHCTVGVCELWT